MAMVLSLSLRGALVAGGAGPVSSAGAGVGGNASAVSACRAAHRDGAVAAAVAIDAAIAGASRDARVRACAGIAGRFAGAVGRADRTGLLLLDLVLHLGNIGVDGLLDACALCLILDERPVVVEDVHDRHRGLLDGLGPGAQLVCTARRRVSTKAVDGAQSASVHVRLIRLAVSASAHGVVVVGLLCELFDGVWLVERVDRVRKQ